MLFKLIVLCALVAAPALASAIKGHTAREETKGNQRPLLAPIEQQQQVKSTKLEHAAEQQKEEQQKLIAEPKIEPEQQQKEEETQAQEETKRYEAKPQVSRAPEPNKEQKYEQQQREEQTSKTRYEQKQQEEKIELPQQLLQQQHEYDTQQIELKEEQRGYEPESLLVQPVGPLTIVEETREQRQQQQQAGKTRYEQKQQEERVEQQQQEWLGASKGAAPAAPLGEAEPYSFGYQVAGSSRSESGDSRGVVRGQYTLQGADGSSRVVDYIADHNGFRASVNTNEFGTEAKSPANIALRTSQPTAEEITLRAEGKTTRDEYAGSLQAGAKGGAAREESAAKPESWQTKGGAQAALPQPQVAAVPQAQASILQEGSKGSPAPKRVAKEVRAPAKGQRLVLQQQQQELEEQQQELLAAAEPAAIKSAEIRAPKSAGELKLGTQTRSSFESATAHRAYRVPAASYVAARPAPAVLVRAHPPPVARTPVPSVSRTYLQRERYPPSPVQGYRRVHYGAAAVDQPQAGNPRVSFYAPSSASFDDEQPDSSISA